MARLTDNEDRRPRANTSAADERGDTAKRKHLGDTLDEVPKGAFPAGDPFALTPENDPNSGPVYASPPCFMHELDPSYFGNLSRAEVLVFLNRMLEGERASARGVGEMNTQVPGSGNRATLRDIANDGTRFCEMLARHITRLGGMPSGETGSLYGKLADLGTHDERIGLLDRGRRQAIEKLRQALPRISDDWLHEELSEMLIAHERNLKRCNRLKL